MRVENLLPACKNLGTTHITNGAFRVHPAEWNIGESAGALAAFCVQRKVLPRQVRAKPSLLADFQKQLRALGVELEWPKPIVAQSYNSMYANVPRVVLRRSPPEVHTAGNPCADDPASLVQGIINKILSTKIWQ